ncbi:MAG: glycosyltransferase family 87 protein, partial [Chloroflexota bacterium]
MASPEGTTSLPMRSAGSLDRIPPRQTLPLSLFCGLVLAGLAGLFVLLAFYIRKGAYGSDWQTFYDAATRWRDHGRVYTVADGFFNPPPTLLLLRLFIFLPYPPSRILWGALSAGMLLAAGWLSAEALAWRPDGRALALGAWWILVSAPCVLLAPLTGNWSGLILLSFSLSVYLFQRGHEGWAGAALAVTLIKPQLAILTLPLLLYKRRWRAVGGYLGAGAISVLVSFPLVGWQAYGDYVQVQRSVADWTLTNNPLQLDVPGLHGLF